MQRQRRMAFGVAMAGAMAVAGLAAAKTETVHVQSSALACRPAGVMMRLAGLPEASGLAASQTTPGRLWAHNDSGKPELFSLDAKGKVTGRVLLRGAAINDWEAMAVARCGTDNCLYVGDIGDNGATRQNITVYRLREPAQAGGSAQVDGVLRASYPDGAHDAETLLALPDGGLFVVTKGETGHAALYRFPRDLQSGTTMRLERVGAPLSKVPLAEASRITDGAVSSDGAWVVLRTFTSLTFYSADEFLKGDFRERRRVDLKSLAEPQGEAVAFGPSDTVYLGGEGGGKSQPGTLAALTCVR